MKKFYPVQNNLSLSVFLIFIFSIFTNTSAIAQVGIGTSKPHPSAILDIHSETAGVLLPQVSLQDLRDQNTINKPAEGLLIYNKHKDNQKHLNNSFYIWDGEKWDKIQSQRDADEINKRIDSLKSSVGDGSGGGWQLYGNNLSGDEYIGAKNEKPIRFKINNIQEAEFGIKDRISIGRNAESNKERSFAYGYGSKSNGNDSYAYGREGKTSGERAYAFGYQASSSGNDSYSFGNEAMTSGERTYAFGYKASSSSKDAYSFGREAMSSGDNSIAIGYQSKSSGKDSYAIGRNSTSSGIGSFAIGENSSSEAQKSIAIGYGAKATKDYTLILGNDQYIGNSDATRVGIGTSNPTERLEVHGGFKLVDETQGEGKVLISDKYGKASWKNELNVSKVSTSNLGLKDGSQGEGKVLTSDANGNASWKDLNSGSSGKVYADLYNNGLARLNNTGEASIIEFDKTSLSKNVQVSNQGIIVQKSGIFKVNATITVNTEGDDAEDTVYEFYFTKEGNKIARSSVYITIDSAIDNNEKYTVTLNKLIKLEQWEQVAVYGRQVNVGGHDRDASKLSLVNNACSFTLEKIDEI
ncbi:hypothetical protein [Zunongwangia endophytica]|uniref:Trimeric autotransporter adhesin YadA-like head domain-containing protein n=1 Tax=Zunongwangia endophytica TaxID=1808945 RepID=A0ABV8H9E8_9FLAO|nr:hypothetical protein [Zunongwangia endophytica]MDN3593911.1 hypothetical protein [Zunongwangia endophytica]